MPRLSNYLRSYRKQSGLSQDQVGYLLGGAMDSNSGARVSRYETGEREPNLRTVLALSVILNVPVQELFAGRYERIARTVENRGKRLNRQVSARMEKEGKIPKI